jgi:hypothetical protein
LLLLNHCCLQVQEAQQALRELQAVVQQLQGAGQSVGHNAQKLLAELQPQHASEPRHASEPQQQQQHEGTGHLPGQLPVNQAVEEAKGEPAQQQHGSSALLQTAARAAKQQVLPAQQSQQQMLQQLDWESIIDFPHGSLRLLGSCKAPWMDSDPGWVTEKCYRPVQCREGVWMRVPLTAAVVSKCSILLTEMEMRVYAQSEEFLEAMYKVCCWVDDLDSCTVLKIAWLDQVGLVGCLV